MAVTTGGGVPQKRPGFRLTTTERLEKIFGEPDADGYHVFVCHTRMQVSDLMTAWLVLNKTEGLFPGISRGIKIVLVSDRGNSLLRKVGSVSDDDFEKRGMTVSGILGGKFDEHEKKASDGKRLLHCECTLLGEELGLLREVGNEDIQPKHVFVIEDKGCPERRARFYVEDARLRNAFAFFANDDLNGSLPMNLAKMVKAGYSVFHNQKKTVLWLHRFLDVVSVMEPMTKQEWRHAYEDACAYLLAMLDEILEDGEFHPQGVSYIRSWIEKGMENPRFGEESIYDLADATAVMLRGVSMNTLSEKEARLWIYWGFRVLLEGQHQIFTTSAEEAKKAVIEKVRFTYEYKGKKIEEDRNIVFIESDDEFVLTYLRLEDVGLDPAFIVKFGSSGAFQVFPGTFPTIDAVPGDNPKKKYYRESLSYISKTLVSALRREECRARGIQIQPTDILTEPIFTGDGGIYYYHGKETGWIFAGGSLSSPDMPKSQLSHETVKWTILNALKNS